MKRALLLIIALAWGSPVLAGGYDVQDSYHKDHRAQYARPIPKLLFNPAFSSRAKRSPEETARAYLVSNHDIFGLSGDLVGIRLVRTKTSLLGTHLHFGQFINDLPVEMAEIIVSVGQNGGIRKVVNNLYPLSGPVSLAKRMLTADKALDIAWNDLGVRDGIMGPLGAGKVYLPEGKAFRAVYKTTIPAKIPHGYWEHIIDAVTGEIIAVRDKARYRKKRGGGREKPGVPEGAILSRLEAQLRYDKQKAAAKKVAEPLSTTTGDGTGLVFDPDPKTTLMDETLEDSSPASAFDGAYLERPLRDLTVTSGIWSLTGPWVTVVDADPPTTPPSTAVDGIWTATRGDNAFNDAMTYFHIDQNQRYIQGLGFTGDTGIQEGAIHVDTDGANGEDNSFFVYGEEGVPDMLAFGHGCVDDNEDADVILHEYFHALQYAINPNWFGGDTGAMAEGFGDFWGASYSHTTPNGPVFHPAWVFGWDAHNTECWEGRSMDKPDLRYDPDAVYMEHGNVDGVNGDELWGTPLYQAFLALGGAAAREEVDTIILQSNFGLGGGLTMREMANVVVDTARALYPDGPHADVYTEKFKAHGIIEHGLFAGELEVRDSANASKADPGKTLRLTVPLSAKGFHITDVGAILSTAHPDIVVEQAFSAYPGLSPGTTENNTVPFIVKISESFSCGDTVNLDLTVAYRGGEEPSKTFSFAVPIGEPVMERASAAPEQGIPDLDPGGVQSDITLEDSGLTFGAGSSVDLNITHDYGSDLSVLLISPAGTEVLLWDGSQRESVNIVGNFPGELKSSEDLGALIGEAADGVWSLFVVDGVEEDEGIFHDWSLNLRKGSTCEAPVESVTVGLNQSVYRAGNPLQFNISVEGGTPMDLYAVVVFPGGDFVTLSGSATRAAQGEIVPYQKGLSLSGPETYHVLDVVLPEGLSQGQYKCYGLLTLPDSDPLDMENWLNFAFKTFELQ